MKTTEQSKVSVTRRAMLQRINRRLARDEKTLRSARNDRMRSSVGDFYVIDWRRNLVVDTWIKPEALARELGVLGEWEVVE